ncbi:MAG: SH3 domain-containing protein [Cyclobacteriaceae bacterium]|nr:SH3 domain-containing protein [Cyclobacteriaceae bacterium]
MKTNYSKFVSVLMVPIFLTVTIAGCVPPGMVNTGGDNAAQADINSCIAKHVMLGALAGAVAGTVASNKKGTGAVVGAIAGGLAGFATAWMSCIGQYSKPTYQKVGGADSLKPAGFDTSKGPQLELRNVFFDPSAVRAGAVATLRAKMFVVTSERDMKIKRVTTYKVVMPDGQEYLAPAGSDEVVKEPGINDFALPIPIPSDANGTRLFVTLQLTGNGVSASTTQEVQITDDAALIEVAKSKATKQRTSNTVIGDEPSNISSQSAQLLVVIVSKANLRASPSKDADVVGKVSKKEKLKIVAEKSDGGDVWFQVKTPTGTIGWINSTVVKHATK